MRGLRPYHVSELVLTAVLLSVPVFGQTAIKFTGVELQIYAPGVTPPSAPLQTIVYPMTGAKCDLPPEAAEPPTLTNPRRFGFPDPANPARQCVVDVATRFLSLPPGDGYRATVAYVYTNGTNTGTTERSPLSNPFRVQEANPAGPTYAAVLR